MKKIIGALFASLSFLTFVSCKEKNDNDNTTTIETTTIETALDPDHGDTKFIVSMYDNGILIEGVYDKNDIGEELVIPTHLLKGYRWVHVDRICDDAFKGFTQIKKLILPSNVKYIDDAFEDCTNLESIEFVDEEGNITKQLELKRLSQDAFKNTKFESMKYEDDLLLMENKIIGFYKYALGILIPDNIEVIEAGTFKDSNIYNVALSNVKIVEDGAFTGSANLKRLYGDYVEYMTRYALKDTRLSELIDHKYILGKVLVYDKIDTDNYIVDENVESVAAVDGSATSIVIPSNIKNIFNDAFKYVDNLEEVYFEHLYGNVNISNGAFDSDIDLIVPYGALNYYVSNNRSYESQFKTKEINISFYKDDTFIKTEKFNYGESLRIPNDYISVKDSNGNVYNRGSVIYFHNDINLYLYEGSVILK